MNEYEKFKKLLEYFVAHLEWQSTKNKDGRGYNDYIAPLIENEKYNKTGQGYRGDSIQNQIKNWSEYENGEICINIQPNFGNYQTVKCYLNWEGTGINVVAVWENDHIDSLELEEYISTEPRERIKLNLKKSINELSLFDNNPPNESIKHFFDSFNLYYKEFIANEENNRKMEITLPYVSLLKEAGNIILTGAPGTGKTYLAKQIAKQMIGVQTDKELIDSGQFAFVQFHPSYDYTDFVEGLRPTKPDSNGNIGFELKNGIFKEFCKKAISVDSLTSSNITSFKLENFPKYLQSLGLTERTVNNYSLRIDQLMGKGIQAKRDIDIVPIYKSIEEICENLEEIKDFDSRNDFHNQFSSAATHLINFKESLTIAQHETTQIKPVFVFVIDEINRGEISKIFGELFFSIDPSYRGKKGMVKTQYANLQDEENGMLYVPHNLYIIGSMNDIDRSVESFDFAMRRRFVWKEITATQSGENMELPEEIIVRMEKLNEQILNIEGLNASYQIGGAYFLDREGKPRNDFDAIWELRLEPLLKEYLRGVPNEDEKMEDLKNAYNN